MGQKKVKFCCPVLSNVPVLTSVLTGNLFLVFMYALGGH